MPIADAAAMSEMNLDAWGKGIVAAGLCNRAEVCIEASHASSPATGEITWGSHQAVHEVLAPRAQGDRSRAWPPATRRPGATSAEGTEADPEEGTGGPLVRRNGGL